MNDTATVIAKKVMNWDKKGDGNPYTPTPEGTDEASFEKPPNGDYDLILVTKPMGYGSIAFQDVGAYMDPVDDGPIYKPQREKGVFRTEPVPVRVEGREGIGTIYWVEVSLEARGSGTTSPPTPTTKPWWGGEVLGMTMGGLLVLKDTNSGAGVGNDDGDDPSSLYCKAAEDAKGDVEFWLTSGTGEYDWAIGTSNGKLNAANEYKYKGPKAADLAVGTHTLTVTQGEDFERKINFTVVAVSLYKNNTDWSADWVLKPTPDLFTLDRVAGIRIEGPGTGKAIKAKMWSSADPEHVATSESNFDENPSGSGVYRNTDTPTGPRWPRFYWTWRPEEEWRRLKVVDEGDKLHVYPVISDVEQEHLEVSEKVDLAEVALIDATASRGAKAFYDGMTAQESGDPCWSDGPGGATGYVTTAKDDYCVSYGKAVDMLYVAGYGLESKPGVYGKGVADDPQRQHPLGNYDATPDDPKGFQPSDIGEDWNNGELEWLVLGARSQLHMVTLGSPIASDNPVKWAKAMPKVHAILGYRWMSPSGPKDKDIAERFANYTTTKKFVEAWLAASRWEEDPKTTDTPWNVAALVQLECVDDKWKDATKFPSPQTAETNYKFYWYDTHEESETYGDLKEETFNLP